jgi:DNA-binding GntR family transcriptional regulator
MLENSGLVSRLRGRGTVVSPEKITRTFSPLQSFEADMANQGIAFETQVLNYAKAVTPDPSICNRLTLDAGDAVGALTLLRLVDDRTICLEQRFYPPDVAERFDPARVRAEPCLLVLQDVIGAKIAASQWESEIVPASKDVATMLGVASRTLVFASSYSWYIRDGRPVEAGTISYRVDRCKFRFTESLGMKRRRGNGEDKTRARQR